jgi:hypothetical protein
MCCTAGTVSPSSTALRISNGQDRCISIVIDKDRCIAVLIVAVLCCVRYRILSGVYRGKYFKEPSHLCNAVKIIMHLSAAHTRTHPQREHARLLDGLDPPAVGAGPFPPPVPAAVPGPAIPADAADSGLVFADLVEARNRRVHVWWMGQWFPGRISHISVVKRTISVLLAGEDSSIAGFLPRHIKLD